MKQLLLILLLISSASLTSAATTYSLSQAKEDMAAGHYLTTIENLRQLVDQDQQSYEAWFLFGVAHVHEQQYHQAIEAFRQVISLRPELAEPHNNLAAVYNSLGDTKAAVIELESALKKRPNYTVAEENLADLYVKLALQHYRNTLKNAPNPLVEQRYARLIQVRNPISANEVSDTSAVVDTEQTTPSKKTVPPIAAVEPKKMPVKLVAKQQPKQKPVTLEAAPINMQDVSIASVLDALEAWRTAWSEKNLAQYFAAYAPDYKPEASFGSQKSWKAYKERVISNKKYITLSFEQVEVTIHPDKQHAIIMFLQRFNSNSYNGNDFKKIAFEHGTDGWKITAEASIK